MVRNDASCGSRARGLLRRSHHFGNGVFVVVLLHAGVTRAEEPTAGPPYRASGSIWLRAIEATNGTNERGIDTDEIHVRVSELMTEASQSGPLDSMLGGGVTFASLDGARQLLERAGARTSHDVRLHFDLGHVLARLRRYRDALTVLQGAVTRAPDHVRIPDALFEIAVCHATLQHRSEEEDTYRRLLEIEDRRFGRAIVYSNLSESLMSQGKLDEAIEASEASLELDPNNALARWTLAVIRDRHEDPFGALNEAKLAAALDPEFQQLDGPGVFFEPAYDAHWYHAVGELAHADMENDPSDQAARHQRLLRALMHYEKWLENAGPTERFAPLALHRVAELRARLRLR